MRPGSKISSLNSTEKRILSKFGQNNKSPDISPKKSIVRNNNYFLSEIVEAHNDSQSIKMSECGNEHPYMR